MKLLKTAALTVGNQLPNGAIVVDYQPDNRGPLPGGVVLALMQESADHYVTWNYWFSENRGEVCCSNGHYFDILTDAVRDFERRCA